MKRALATVIATGTLVLTTLVLAPIAQAITNPADNPHPITVKGDDGKTYTDGEDTLPGYDDEECTYIPGAYFDFDNNRVRYADGQSIPWTEWDRATGYEAWKAKKAAASAKPSTASTPKPGKASSSKSASTTTKKSTAATKAAGSKKSTTAQPSTSASATASPSAGETQAIDGATDDASVIADPASGTPTPTTSAGAEAGEVDEVTLAAGAPSTADAADASSSGGSGSAGLLILGGLAGVGLVAFAGRAALGRRSRKATSA